MIKLVTQFDNEKTKLSLATPTCGCCSCCCCCCIVSTVAAASISARNFGKYVENELPNEPEKIKSARNFGFWLVVGLAVTLLTYITGNSLPGIIILAAAYLFIITTIFKKMINLPGLTSRIIQTLLMLAGIEFLGFWAGLYALEAFASSYLILAIAISVIIILCTFRKKDDEE